MEDIHKMEGAGDHRGDFEITFLSHVNAQRVSCYTHNGVDKIAFDIKHHEKNIEMLAGKQLRTKRKTKRKRKKILK